MAEDQNNQKGFFQKALEQFKWSFHKIYNPYYEVIEMARDSLYWQAVRENKLKTLKDIFSSQQVTPNDMCIPESGHTFLHESISTNRREIFMLCLTFHADVNARDRNEWTPLMKAVALGRLRMVPELLERGADPFMTDKKGQNSFDKAVFYERLDVLNMLNEYVKQSQPNRLDVDKYKVEMSIDENEKF